MMLHTTLVHATDDDDVYSLKLALPPPFHISCSLGGVPPSVQCGKASHLQSS